MSNVFIIGAGGHAKVVADILLLHQQTIIGFLDDNPQIWNTCVLGMPVLGAIQPDALTHDAAFIVAIGVNRIRKQIVERLEAALSDKLRWVNALHPSGIMTSTVQMGHGNVMAAGSIINPDSSIGHHVIINTGASVDHDCIIGDFVHLAPGVRLAGGVQVETGAFIGLGAVVTPNCVIGQWATIGAGAAVIKDVPAYSTMVGVPARIIKSDSSR